MSHPPRYAKALLRRFCNVEFLEEIEGDLDEQFHDRCLRHGTLMATIGYWRDTFRALRRTRTSRTEVPYRGSASTGDMFAHFLLVSVRHLRRNRSTTIINISGLGVSLACFLFIAFYLIDESTYDILHPDAENTYRISHSWKAFGKGDEETDARVPGLWALALKDAMPEITHVTRFSRFGYPGTMRYEKRDMVNVEPQFFWVDSTYTEIFALPLKFGDNPAKILRHPSQIIVNESSARRYFGDDDPIGQTLIYSRDGLDIPLVVAGVMKDYPSNVHFHPDFMASNMALTPLWNRQGVVNSSFTSGADRVNSWRDSFTYSYVSVTPGTTTARIDTVLRGLLRVHLGEDAKFIWPTIVKLTDLHFHQGMLIELEHPGDPVYRYLFGSIGVLILLIACINYMNMATAKSLQRSKEVGLRKTLGIRRGSLIIQFLGESMLVTSVAILLAVGMVAILLPTFNTLAARTITVDQMLTSGIPLFLIGLIFIVGIISGSYPAFYLSAFKPLDVIRGKLHVEGGAERFRKSLVIFQLTITILLIVGTLVIHRQLSYINTTKLSQFKDQMVTVRLFGIVQPRNIVVFSEQIKRMAAVDGVSIGTQLPRQDSFSWMDVQLRAPQVGDEFKTWKHLDMDADFPSLFKLDFVAGRDFSLKHPTDTGTMIINEAGAAALGMTPDKTVGLTLEDRNNLKREVIGVVRNFSYASIRTRVEPLAITSLARDAEVMYIKLSGNDLPETIAVLEKTWKQVFPATPFQHWFLNEEFDQLYRQEKSTGTLFSYFSILAIAIGCLGLFGLASYTVEQRTREIGIRKVLGASGGQITLMLTSRFIKLVVIAMVMGTPLAYYLMRSWLQRFAYQTELPWWLFAAAGLALLLITCVTVGLETVKAAQQNPIHSLKRND